MAQYHAKDSNNLFMVRIAQGLVHMGKGTMTLNPFHSDNQVTLELIKNKNLVFAIKQKFRLNHLIFPVKHGKFEPVYFYLS